MFLHRSVTTTLSLSLCHIHDPPSRILLSDQQLDELAMFNLTSPLVPYAWVTGRSKVPFFAMSGSRDYKCSFNCRHLVFFSMTNIQTRLHVYFHQSTTSHVWVTGASRVPFFANVWVLGASSVH